MPRSARLRAVKIVSELSVIACFVVLSCAAAFARREVKKSVSFDLRIVFCWRRSGGLKSFKRSDLNRSYESDLVLAFRARPRPDLGYTK